jgi:hypothetical protein
MTPAIRIFARPSPHQTAAARWALDGFARHGLSAEIVSAYSYTPCDLAVCWGVHHEAIFAGQRTHGGRVLVMERAYLGDRTHWVSMGYDGLNGRAQFYTEDVPSDRAAAHWSHALRPWRDGGHYALLLGQVPGDAAVRGLQLEAWVRDIARALVARGYLVVFRPHPQARQTIHAPALLVQARRDRSLDEELAEAAVAVTWNSNAGVDAVLAGVPTVALDEGSMAWPVTSHAIQADPVRPDRRRWLERLAYCQWTPDEIAHGDAWAHLRQGLEVAAA